MAVGDGNGNPVEPNPAQTFLARERYRAGINQLTVDPVVTNRFTAELVIPADEGGFTIREVGLYDVDGKLFAVGNVPDTYKPTPSEGAFSDTIVRMVFMVENASIVQVAIDPNVTVATHSWVINNVNATTVIPGGLTNQVLAKKSNADGDTEWRDPAAAVDVIVYSREETQTLAADQVEVDLAVLNTEGVAVYIEGVRLRDSEFTTPTVTQIVLAQAYPAGTRVTAVQNEEVGKTEVLFRAANLADVLDKAAAINNLGLPNWLTTRQINWSQLVNVPAVASRWPNWGEVTDKPATYPPAAHNQDWSTIDNKPAFATRWPAWGEVSNKPSTFTPSAHSHSEYVQKAGDVMTGPLQVVRTPTATLDNARAFSVSEANDQRRLDVCLLPGTGSSAREILYRGINTARQRFSTSVSADGGFDFGSSLKLKNVDGPLPYGLAAVERIETVVGHYKPEFNADGRRRLFFVAEQLAEVIPEAVDLEGIEFNGERVASVKVEQLLPVAFAAIRELSAKVRALEERVFELEMGQ